MYVCDTLLNAGIVRVGLDCSCRISSMSTDIVTYVWAPLMASCIVVFVVVLVLLPNLGDCEYEATEKQPPDKWHWAAWVVTVAIIWFSIVIVFAFLTRSDSVVFLMFAFPILFLLHAVLLGFFAYRFKIDHPDRVRKEPDDVAEARKRLGLD